MERDYTGVATKDLAELLIPIFGDPAEDEQVDQEVREERTQEMEIWCARFDIPIRSLRRIRRQEYQFTGFALADKIFDALQTHPRIEGIHVIPANAARAALRMAEDELAAIDDEIDPVALAARAAELRVLREEVLGERTEAQKAMIEADMARTRRRQALAS